MTPGWQSGRCQHARNGPGIFEGQNSKGTQCLTVQPPRPSGRTLLPEESGGSPQAVAASGRKARPPPIPLPFPIVQPERPTCRKPGCQGG